MAAAKKEFREKYLSKYSFVEGEGALGVGRQILAQGDRSMAVGDYAKAISNDAIAYGGQTLANGTNSMAMGGNAHVGTIDTSFDNSMAIGSHTNVQAGNAVALGAFSQVTGQNSLALGFGKQSGDDIAYNSVSGKDSTLIGSYGTIQGNNSILIGSNGNIANDRVVGLGNNINIEKADQNDQENNTAGSVFLGDHAGYVKDSKRSRSLGQVDVVGSTEKMKLTESLSSTKGALRGYTEDFIYIYMLKRQDDGTQIVEPEPIAVRSDFAGGDSTVGVVSVGSTYEQKFNSLQDIKNYHSKAGSLITVPVDVTVQVTKNGVSLGEQQQTRYFAADSTREEIYADSTLSKEDKAKVWNTIDTIQKSISSSDTSSDTTFTVFETRRIQNVAPGLIGLNSTDAINGSQLFATNQMLGNLVGSLKNGLGDNVTVTEDGQITVTGKIKTLGWIAKADKVGGSNGTVAYDADKKTDETEKAYQDRIDKLKTDGYIVDASKVMTFKASKNIGLVQKPGEFSISTIDTPSFTSVELRGETREVDGSKVTPVTMMDSSGMKVYTETVTPGDAGTTTTQKVSTTVNNEGVTTDGKVVVNNGKTGDEAKEFVTIDKGTDGSGTDKEYGKIGLDGKNGSNATITIDRGTKSLNDDVNIGVDPSQPVSETNKSATMDRITYTTTGPNKTVINHEVATLDDGFFLTTSKDMADKKAAAKVKLNNTIKFTDGANTKVSTVDSKEGVHELHINVTGLPMTYTVSQTGDAGTSESVSKVGDTYQLADGTKLVKVGDKFYKPSQLVDPKADQPQVRPEEVGKDWTVNDSISLVNKDGSNNAPTLKNVGSGLKNAAGNSTSIDQAVGSNAVNVDDLRTIGKAATTEVTGTGAAEVTKVTGANGQNIYNVHVDKLMTVKPVDANTKIARGGDGKYYNTDDIAGKIFVPSENKWYNTADVDKNTGKPLTGKTPLDNQPIAVEQNKLKNSVVNPNGDGPTVLDNVKSGIGGEVKDAAGNNTFIDNINKVGKKSDDDTAAPDAISENTVVNAKDLKNLVDTGFKLNTSGHSGDAQTVKIGDTINIIDGANTKVSAIDDSITGTHTFHIDVTGLPVTYTATKTDANGAPTGEPVDVSKVGDGYQLADGTKLVKYGDKFYKQNQIVNGQPVGDAQGFTINDDIRLVNPNNGTGPVKITNVAPGEADTDAVNMSQLKQKVAAATTEVTGTGAAEVTKESVGDNGRPTYKVHVDKLVEAKADDGKAIVRGEDNKFYYKDESLKQGKDGKWYPQDKLDDDGNPEAGAVGKNIPISGTDPVPAPADSLKTSLVNPNDPNSKVKLDNIKSAIGGKVNGADGTNSFIDNLDKVGKEGGIGNDAAVTTGDLKNLADTPLFFGGDSADGESTDGKEHTNTFDRKLGKQINIKGEVDLDLGDNATAEERKAAIKEKLSDRNIGVISNGKDTLTVKLSKDLKDLNTIEVNDSVSVGKDGDSTVIKGDSLTASSKDENGHDKVTNISSDGFNSTAITFERDGNGQIVRNPDTGLPKEVTNKTNINSDGFTATRTDSEGNEVLKTTMQNGNIAIETPQPIINPTTGEAYKVLDKNGNWVPAHGYTKISDNGFEIQGINQSGTGISKVRLSSEGLDNGGNRITHVAEGIAPDDAVNVSQLRGLTQNINNDIANVGANAAALAGLKAIQYDPLEPTQIMAAVGTYRGKQAAALGIAHYKNEDTMFHMGVSIGSDHTMANVGVTYKFGRTDEKKAVPDRYKAGPISSTYVLQDEMVALKEENARMRANDEKMNAAYDEILDLVKQLKQDNEEMKKKLEKLEKK